MTPPPALAAAALALWSWASERWIIGACLAVLLEGARLLPLALDIDQRGFRRIALATRIVLFAMLGWELTQRAPPMAMLAMLGWLPVIFAPLLLAQRASAAGTIPVEALRMRRATFAGGGERLDMAYFYLCATLLSAAGMANNRSYFYSALVAVVGFALVGARTRGRLVPASILFAVAVAIGQFGHIGLASLQHRVEEGALNLLGEWLANNANADRSRTRIGDLGRVKLSDRILMRVVFGPGTRPPLLLRDGGYSNYEGGTWTNPSGERRRIDPAGLERRFVLDPVAEVPAPGDSIGAEPPALTIAMRLPGKNAAPIAAPLDASRIERLAADALFANGRGGLLAESGTRYVQFDVWRGGGGDAAPAEDDLATPPALRPALDRAYAELALPDRARASQAVDAIQRFFAQYFRYTLYLGAGAQGTRSLADFLSTSRAGHCEYFASATVMLLRRAGIPARYATGYAVEEWSDIDRQYVVRARHGHAWALAWIDGRWTELDTTPAEWASIEERETRSMWLPLFDLASSLRERFDRWRAAGRPIPSRALWALAAIAAITLAWRYRRALARPRARVLERVRRVGRRPTPAGALASIEAHFAARGVRRPPARGWRDWVDELERAGIVQGEPLDALRALVQVHYRERFGPHAGSVSGRGEGTVRVAREWLANYGRAA